METTNTYIVVPYISGLLDVLLDRLASEKMRELLLTYSFDADAELSKLMTSIMEVKRAVDVAEEKQEVVSDVKNWLNDVKHAVYVAENMVDQIHTEALRKQVQLLVDASTQPNVLQLLKNTSCSVWVTLTRSHIARKISDINSSFEKLCFRMKTLGLMHSSVKQSPKMLASQPTSSFVDESKIVGRVSERDRILQVLKDRVVTSHQRSTSIPVEDNIHVIAIVGTGGIGKTTLAQSIYNHPTTDSMFDLKAWVYVPKEFDATQIISKILDLLPEPSGHQLSMFRYPDNLQLLQNNLRHKVMGKRMMIILDDPWHEIPNDTWQHVLISLKPTAPGSTIIVTTRNGDTVKNLHPILIVPLDKLPDDDVWTLFNAHAYGDPQAAPDENCKTFCKEVVDKCKGLPLAIRALGRLLSRFPTDTNEWKTIAKSKLWDSDPKFRKEILPVLLLSFYYLPEPVKRCFAYCSLFPKNYQFDKENLVLLWMAEGFIEMSSSNSGETMENIGKTYFDELKAQFFFQVSNSEQRYFVMHNLIHDLAIFVMGEFGLMHEPKNSNAPKKMLRHFSYKQSKYDTLENFALDHCAHQLRTSLPVESRSCSAVQSCYYLSNSLLQSLDKFANLRVLSLRGYKITKIPGSIGRLDFLCYLDFSFTYIEELPESIGDLSNLQTLLLRHCERLRRLPASTTMLINLRHLDVYDTDELQEMPDNLGKLSSLQTLPHFVVGKNKRKGFKELGNLLQLRGNLKISGLENVFDEGEALEAKLSDKADVVELVLMQQECYSGACRHHVIILQALKPHTNLRRLTIYHYKGVKFPDWIGNEEFHNLEFLHLESCPNCKILPPLGNLPSLNHLIIKDFEKLENVGAEFYGQHSGSSSPFNSLTTLEFKGLGGWKIWFGYEGDVDPFPCLEKLIVQDCNKLKRVIPLKIPALVDLDIRRCNQLDGSLPELLNLRKLRLERFGRLVLTSLVGISCLTELRLSNDMGSEESEDDWMGIAKEALPLMKSLERLTITCTRECTLQGWHLPSSVRSVTFNGKLIQQFDTFINGCTNLQYLSIKDFDSSIQFPRGHSQLLNNLRIESCDMIEQSQIIFGLEFLHELTLSRLGFKELNRVLAARNLTTLTLFEIGSLPTEMTTHFPCLEFLCIDKCPLGETFPKDGLPPKLQTLELRHCEELQSLSNHMTTCTSLQRLSIEDCSKLKSLPENGIPPNLKFLKLGKILLNYAAWQLNQLNSLQQLEIDINEDEVLFPANFSLPSSLAILKLSSFRKLRSLNCKEFKRIGCLRELEIVDCPSLLSLYDGELPKSLYRLTILGSPKFAKRIRYWDYAAYITCLQLEKEPSKEDPSVSGINKRGIEGFYKLVHCLNGCLSKLVEIRISESSTNYGRPYYECRSCGAFKWVGNDDILPLDYNEATNRNELLSNQIQVLRLQISALQNYINMIVKFAIVMFVVLLYVCYKVSGCFGEKDFRKYFLRK